LLASKYRVVRVVGEGGMGVVYEGLHERLGQRVAIKVVRLDEERTNDEFIKRFEREARTAAKLQGPNVARVSDVDTLPDGTPFMVMEFLEGTDLDFELANRGPLPVQEAVGYVLQACSAVAEAHAHGVVHRDLKPHNLFLAVDSGKRVVKLLDFGISRIESEQEKSVTLTRSSLGTPLYMSPEQIRSSRHADERSDIWSLGVILYELLTGRTPFDGESPSAVIAAITADVPDPPNVLCSDVPPTLAAAVMKALQKSPALRYQKVAEFAEAVLPFGPRASWLPPPEVSRITYDRVSIPDAPTVRLESPPFLAEREAATAPEPAPKSRARRNGLLVAALGVLVLAALFVGWRARASAPPMPAEASSAQSAPPDTAVAHGTAAPEPRVEPAVMSEPPAAKSATTRVRPAKRRTVGRVAPPPPPTPSAKPSPPPPAPTDNPVHL
jgi:eukaryotic-like serine/threonine-protein kinase